MRITSSRAAIACAIAGVLTSSSREASADEPAAVASLGTSWSPPSVLTAVHGGGAGAVGSMPSGPFLGVETGYAALLPSSRDAAEGAWTFGGRAGYQLRSGLALQLRADDLGVSLPGTTSPLVTSAVGVRYSAPLAPMPFAEALVGPAFAGDATSVDAGLGVGVSLPILRHLVVDASARDWITDFASTVRHTVTFDLGFTIGFGRGS